jgi:hypothetical protein
MIALMIIAVCIVGVTVLVYENPFVATTTDPLLVSGHTLVRGTGSASDGRLTITIHNFRFNSSRNILPNDTTLDPRSIFLMVNVTVANIGGGNSSISGFYAAQLLNGSKSIVNTEFVDNAYFPNLYPHEAYPYKNGGLYLPPGASKSYWAFFYIPKSESLSLATIQQTLLLQRVAYLENGYGGMYLGNGEYTGSVQVNMEFIIAPP